MFELAVLIASASLNGLLGLVVYLKNPGSWTNRLFLAMTSSFAIWSTVNYFSLHPRGLSQLEWIRLVMFCAAALCLSVFLTFQAFPNRSMPASKYSRKLAILGTLIVMPLTLTPLVFKSLVVDQSGAHPQPNPGIGLFAIAVVGLLGGGVWTLIKKFRRSQGLPRVQIKLVLFGLTGAFSLIVLTDFLLVVVFHYSKLVPLGPAYSLIFSGATAYAIARHSLFDIRATIARTLAYLLVAGSLALIYAIGFFGVINEVFRGPSREVERQLFSIFLITPLALGFQSLKRYFDGLTNKIFFRDAYDPQDVIDKLGSVITAEINLQTILDGSRAVLIDAVKSSFIEFVLFKDGKPMLASQTYLPASLDRQVLAQQLSHLNKELMVVEEMPFDDPFRQFLSRSRIAIGLRLKTEQQNVGYVLFGDKQTGDIYSHQDLKLLSIVPDELAVAIQNALRFDEIRRFNITLQQKIEEATKELALTNQKLKDLDAAKDEFISMASHQLRTPLTAIKGYLSMILEGDVGPVTQDEKTMIKRAFDSAQKMVYLIADLLNVSRLQSGKFVIDNKPTNLAAITDDEVGELLETAQQRKINLVYQPPANFPTLMLDENKIRQVIMNFMDNAIYYTPAGGSVTVTVQEVNGQAEVTVTDTGVGVPKEIQPKLFAKFYRADNARKMRPDGTGLGLFMAKKVIDAQGGNIIFYSQEGKGSTFGFRFPIGAGVTPAPRRPVAETAAKL